MATNSVWLKLTKATYIFYILLSLAWLLAGFFWGGYLNYFALGALLAFAAQWHYKNKIANLILGIVLLPSSIFWLLRFLWEGRKNGFDVFANTMATLSFASIIFSIILVFSYLKLSFGDE